MFSLLVQDYDADDIEEFKDILLRECDVNHDGRINKDELSMVLVSFTKASQAVDGGEGGEADGEGDTTGSPSE